MFFCFLREKHRENAQGTEEDFFEDVTKPSQTGRYYLGRIFNEFEEGEMNKNSVLLESVIYGKNMDNEFEIPEVKQNKNF